MAEIGDNRYPRPGILAQLQVDFANTVANVAELENAAAGLPEKIASKEDHDAIADMIKTIRDAGKGIDGSREAEKSPYLLGGAAVDGFFKPLVQRLTVASDILYGRLQTYLREKAAEERRQREEAAAKAAAEAARKRREEDAAREAAEAARRADYRARHEARAAQAAQDADNAEGRARAAELDALVKPAELARTRSDQGALSTLKSEWTFTVDDYDAIPLDKLRPYITRENIEKAIRQFVKNGNRELAGVNIFQTEKATVR